MLKTSELKDNPSSRLFWVVDFAIVLYVVLDVIAQILPPHYSPITQPESILAVGPYGYIMSVNFLVRGILSIFFVLALTRALDMARLRGSKIRTGVYSMLVWAVGSAALAFFPTDVSLSTPTLHGLIHLVVAIVAFICGGSGSFIIARNLPSEGYFLRVRRVAQSLSFVVVLLLLIDIALPLLLPHLYSRIGGLVERLFLGSLLLWIGVVSTYFVGLIKSQGNKTNRTL